MLLIDPVQTALLAVCAEAGVQYRHVPADGKWHALASADGLDPNAAGAKLYAEKDYANTVGVVLTRRERERYTVDLPAPEVIMGAATKKKLKAASERELKKLRFKKTKELNAWAKPSTARKSPSRSSAAQTTGKPGKTALALQTRRKNST